MEASYVLPLRRAAGEPGLEELAAYLRWLARHVEVVVADGSEPDAFAENAQAWGPGVVHVPVVTRPRRYGKVIGVHVGMEAASHEAVIIADDDVRYSLPALEQVVEALGTAELVRPQNYFDPLPWHAAWDTARILLNRAVGQDSPGTLAVRRSFFVAMGGYSDEVMYENLELIRTVAAHGGRVADRPDVYVRRVPGTVRRFLEQRPRQAYDDFAQPAKLLGFLAVGPLTAWTARRGSAWPIAALAAGAVAMAEMGRRRHGGTGFFPARCSWHAPLWMAERSVWVWLALLYRISGGVPYAGTRFRVPAHSMAELRLRARARAVASVAEGRGAGSAAPAQGDHGAP